jgi:hypothetical protein
VDPCFFCLSASAAFAAGCLRSLFCSRSFHPSASAALFLAAASADAACALALACFFYSRIALSFTIKAALYNASVMLS